MLIPGVIEPIEKCEGCYRLQWCIMSVGTRPLCGGPWADHETHMGKVKGKGK